MCGSMVDIHSPTAKIRRGKKDERRKKPQDENIMSAFATKGGHNYTVSQTKDTTQPPTIISTIVVRFQ